MSEKKLSCLNGIICKIYSDNEFSIFSLDEDRYDYDTMSCDELDNNLEHLVRINNNNGVKLEEDLPITVYGIKRGHIFDASSIETNAVKIKIKREFFVDRCIAKEILELNNIHNINTIYSCCGHGIDEGMIHVSETDKGMMRKLGYIEISDDTAAITIFKPKSLCICRFSKDNRNDS